MSDQFQRLRELSGGYEEWQVRKDDGIVAWFNHTMSPTPERDANAWLQNHQREYPARFAGYEVRKERVYTEIQSEALALLAEVEGLRKDKDRTERNRDMWKDQCERQALRLGHLHEVLDSIKRSTNLWHANELAETALTGRHWTQAGGPIDAAQSAKEAQRG